MSTEAQIENALIAKLRDLKYSYRADIRDRAALEQNFRQKFEALNRVHLTDGEFSRLLEQIITPDLFAAAQRLRTRSTFERDDGTPLHYTLVNIKEWCKNEFEVVNQLRINTQNSYHRYDVVLLINGVPVVQMELKTLDVSPRRAMQQIVEYKNDPGNGYSNTLLCFMQLFVVSNRSNTYYFANNDNKHFAFNADERFLPVYQFAAKDNTKIVNLDEFAEQFLAKCVLGDMLSRYMVLVETEKKLMVMRPYQIYAVEAIVACIEQNRGNGYIWHTTGSGKTLTSFKASTLLKDNPAIEKCLFVVDRKDLDRQTRLEFNKFQTGCVEENTNTNALVRRMLSSDYADKVIVTTIQKLGLALDGRHKHNYKERLRPLSDKRMVFIFDECHRSQFGENHRAIREFFPKAQLFGFTGTPIFEENASYQQIEGKVASYKTTTDIFQKELHAYTITHAIEDRNVLGFHIDYFKEEGDTPAPSNEAHSQEVSGHSPTSILPQRGRKPSFPSSGEGIKGRESNRLSQEAVVRAILEKHAAATANGKFNALLATASINHAIAYYHLFKEVQAEKQAADADFRPLRIAAVFSPPAEGNKDVRQLQEDLPQEKADNQQEPTKKKEALIEIIADYNAQYGSNHDINHFDLYYQDVQQRIKDQQYPNQEYPREQKIDIVIVVDMLLTGFDSKYLNTLYVDKKLRYHGLIQAFSRTNRVLNDSKPWGNILDFRRQRPAVDEAIALFSGEHVERAKKVWLVDPAPMVIEKLATAVSNLDLFMQTHGLEAKPEQVVNLKGDAARAEFINRFKEVQRLKTQLDQYTDMDPAEVAEIEEIITEDRLRSFKGVYLDVAQRLKAQQGKSGDPNGAVEQLDFEFVLFASAVIDYDYIMGLIARYSQSVSGKEPMSLDQLIEHIASSANIMDEREDIADYVHNLHFEKGMSKAQVEAGYAAFKAQKLAQELTRIADTHGLARDALQMFVDGVIGRMIFDGEQLSDLLAPLGLGWKARAQKEMELMADLMPLLKKMAHGRDISGMAAYE